MIFQDLALASAFLKSQFGFSVALTATTSDDDKLIVTAVCFVVDAHDKEHQVSVRNVIDPAAMCSIQRWSELVTEELDNETMKYLAPDATPQPGEKK